MKTVFFCFCLVILTCKSYSPFLSRIDKRQNIQLIKKNIKLSNLDYNLIKKEDTILYELGLSIKDTVMKPLIKRRIDSFVLGNYNKKEFVHMLKLDRVFSSEKTSVELDRNVDSKGYLEFETMEEGKKFLEKLDSSLSKEGNIKIIDQIIKKDSI